MMVNIDIRLTDRFKYSAGAFEVGTVHGDECIKCSLDGGLDLLCALQIFEGRWHTIRQDHLHFLAGLLKSQSQSKQRADRVAIGTNMGSNEKLLCLSKSSLDCFIH